MSLRVARNLLSVLNSSTHIPILQMSTVDRRQLADVAAQVEDPKELKELEESTQRHRRSLGLEATRLPITNEVQMSRENHRKQHLQPRSLPNYFKSNTDFSTIELRFERNNRY